MKGTGGRRTDRGALGSSTRKPVSSVSFDTLSRSIPVTLDDRRSIPAFRSRGWWLLLSCAAASCAAQRTTPPTSAPADLPATTSAAALATDEPERPARGPAVTESQDVPQQTGGGKDAPPPGSPFALTPSEVAAHEEATKPASAFPDWLHGSFAVRYRLQSNGDVNDQDLGGLLALDFADSASSRVSGHVQARVDVDVDGEDDDGVFGSLDDTYDRSVVAKLYLAYADIAVGDHPETSPGLLRVGRQSDPRLPEVLRIDGVSYVTRPMGKRDVELGAYGGVPVHLYESSSEGDRAFGTFAEGRPWSGGRARIDWMHIEDEDVLGAGEDDLFALALWQEIAERWHVEGEYTHLEGDPRDLRLRALYGDPETGAIVRVGYYELLEPQRALVTELDPFFEQLLDYEPFRQANLNMSHPVSEHTDVDVGVDVRRVSDSDDVGEFNRDWERYYATATFHDLAKQGGLALAVTADLWNDDDRDISSFGADLSYESEKRWRAAIGSYYSLYKYVFLELDEREDVRTYYVRTTYDLSKRSELEILYEFENDDFDTYHTLRLGARWRF